MNAQPVVVNRPRPKFDLEERLLDYSAEVIQIVDTMKPSLAGRRIGDQLLRAGTNPPGSHGEAQSAESAKDFIHKMSVGLKELRETCRWLRLVERAILHQEQARIAAAIRETDELIRIFYASIQTAQKRLTRKP